MEVDSHDPSSRLRSEPFTAQGSRRSYEKKSLSDVRERSSSLTNPLDFPTVSTSSADVYFPLIHSHPRAFASLSSQEFYPPIQFGMF